MRKLNETHRLSAIAAAIGAIAITNSAQAESLPRCLVDTPPANLFPLAEGDFPTRDGWRVLQMVDRTLTYDNGMTERFNKDGTYELTVGGTTWTAPSYRFYSGYQDDPTSGFACIAFPDLRFHRYVVNNKQLVLIDGFGDRHVATITN